MALWSIAVSLAGVDISARIVGQLKVQAEQSTARIASFTYMPPPGVLDVADWTGAAVIIDHIADPLGVPVVTRLFTGKVNLPTFDPVTAQASMECTDDLQGHFEAMDEASILAAITGGRYSLQVFGEREDGWQQAMDVLSTVPKSYDLNRDGVTATLTDWAAGVAAFSYNAIDHIQDGSVAIDLAEIRTLINRVTIDYQYRYTRLHHREHGFAWNGFTVFCDWLVDTYQLATRDMITSAASGAGWAIQGESGVTFETLPPTGTYCPGSISFVISDADQNQLVTNASWTAVRRWAQTVTETYTITVEDATSVTRFGLTQAEAGAGYQQDYDDAAWDASGLTDTPAWSVDAIGDYVEDQVDRTASENALLTLIQAASTRILETHRNNYLSATVEIEPTLERHHTVSLDAGVVSGVGKIFSYTHSLDIDEGSALTAITIAVSKSGTGGVSDPITTPALPDTQPTHLAPASSTVLPHRIGNDDTAPDYDPAWVGGTGNYSAVHGSPTPAQIYPWRFSVLTPDIEPESRDEVSAETLAAYNVQAPDEVLVISV